MTKNTIAETAQDLNRLILGDNLEVLARLPDESVDLIYLDPPFFSNRNYEVIWGDKGEVRSFEDRWSGGVDHYIAWLKERVVHLHRILKPTGSIFLHCDWHANAHIRVYILDKIFGEQNFNSAIVWQRHNSHNDAKKKLAVLTDTIFYYAKSSNFIYNPVYTSNKENYLKNTYRFQDERGKYRLGDLTAPNIRYGESGKEWKGYNPTDIGRSWAVPNVIIEELIGKEKCEQIGVLEKLDLLFENGYIFFSKNGIPSIKRYLDQSKGAMVGDVWTDILSVQSASKERIGYPTQKPEALLERIIQMASNEGDVVLDPFVGGGTTVVVAERLKRRWIGIDQSVAAVKVTEQRLNNQRNLFSQPFTLELHKYDYDTLRYSDAFQFERFIVQQYGGTPNSKQRSDWGLDGRSREGVPIQVKRSDDIGRNVVDNFHSAIRRHDKALFEKRQAAGESVGILIAFSFGKGARQEVARLKNEENAYILLVEVAEIVEIAKKPRVSISAKSLGKDAKGLHEVAFVAKGESEAGIEFYSWDFAYDAAQGFRAEVFVDRDGEQSHKLKPGSHQIAAKAIDREGLEGMEVLTIQVNGELHTR
jgi:DNA modification methylase